MANRRRIRSRLWAATALVAAVTVPVVTGSVPALGDAGAGGPARTASGHQRRRLLALRRRRRHLLLRHGQLRGPGPQPGQRHRRHGRHPVGQRLLDGRRQRRRVRRRRRRRLRPSGLPRRRRRRLRRPPAGRRLLAGHPHRFAWKATAGRRPSPAPTRHAVTPHHGAGADRQRRRAVDGRHRRRRLHLRRCRVLRVDGRPAPQPADRRDGAHADRPGLLAGGVGRRDLLLRRCRLLRVDGRHRPQPARSSGWPPRRAAPATGWWPPTAGSSPSATPGSSARWAARGSTRPVRGMLARPGSPQTILGPADNAPPGAPGTPAPGPPGTPPRPASPGPCRHAGRRRRHRRL